MFGGNDANPLFPLSMDNLRHHNANAVPSMQLDVLVGCNGGTMNMSGVKHETLGNLPMKLGGRVPVYSTHKLPVTLHDHVFLDETGRSKSMLKQIPVSTGLRLSYGEEEHNSSVSSVGESKVVNLSSVMPHGDNFQAELARQNDEFDQYIRVQEETIRKGILQLNHRHTVSILNSLEKEVGRKLQEKDIEIENLNRKNRELSEKIRQIEAESQCWHYKAKESESIINLLKTNISQILVRGTATGAAYLKEGCGESVVDDAVSSCNNNNQNFLEGTNPGSSGMMNVMNCCKACKGKEMSVLFLPCRHLCLCIDCDFFIEVCPVCHVKKQASLQVYLA